MCDVKGELCRGCLCTDRKLSLVKELRKEDCFMKIINETQVTPRDSVSLWLCWECEANILRFVRFKRQVKFAYKILQELDKQHKNLPHIERSSQLGIHRVVDINLDPNITEYEPYKVIKVENENFDINITDEDIKVESDHASLCSDEDTLLIEYKKKKKDLNGTKRERRKRKKDIEMDIYKEIELSKEEILEERRLQELREEYVNAMFRCQNCIVSFPNVDDLKDHVNVKHNLNSSHYKCDICTCSFSSEVSYNYHTNKHTRRYQCGACSERFASKRSATKHYELFHTHETHMNFATYKTSQANGNFNNTSTDHISNQETPSFPCEFCDKTFKWKTSLRKHVETHRIQTGQKRKPYCEPCSLSFTTTSNLQKHVKTSSKHQIQLKLRKLVTDSVLEDTSTPEKQEDRISQIKYSVMTSHQQFPCPQCDKKFQWRGNLLRHLHSHTARANGELVCAPCNRTFSSIATYKQHMAISKKHVTENDFKYMCNDCGKRFANKTRLKDHVDWEHLKNYVHTCGVCQKVFKSHTSLYLHKQVVHKKDGAAHLCDHCGKAFPNHAKLRSHITAFHTRQSPYKCAQCAARFNWHSCLSRHVRRVHRRCKEP